MLNKITAREPFSVYKNLSVTATVAEVSADRKKLHGYKVDNPNTSEIFIQLFNKLPGDVTAGTTEPDYTIKVPESGSVHFISEFALYNFNVGFTIIATTTEQGSTTPTTAASVFLYLDK